ncbi:MAG TPA: helix-turn-helix domain-containing protein [Jatrophihabitans sp.]|nr:helix-turn-helix domain-containing protein [Jatrophihabitans sp.]
MAGVDEIAATALDQVGVAASADSGGVDPELLEDFLPALAAAVAAGRRLPRGQVQRCRVLGERAAREGVTLRAVLDLYLSAAWRLWRQLPVVQRAARDPARVVTAGEVMLRAVEDAAAALADGYQAARRGLVRAQESARREFVDDLLSGPGDVAALLHRAADFGLDLSGPHAVAVVAADKPFVDRAPLTGMVERALLDAAPAAGAGVLVASKQNRLVVVFAAPDAAAADEVVRALTGVLAPATADPGVDLRRRAEVGAWRTTIGRARPGAAGVRASYEDARAALELAARLELPGQVVHAADLLVYQVLLRDRAAITDLVIALLDPLRRARGGAEPLLDTLAAYYDAGGNAAEAARAMHLSVRALTYRLQRVHELTGHDPTRSTQRFALHAAVLGAKLLNWPAVPLDR